MAWAIALDVAERSSSLAFWIASTTAPMLSTLLSRIALVTSDRSCAWPALKASATLETSSRTARTRSIRSSRLLSAMAPTMWPMSSSLLSEISTLSVETAAWRSVADLSLVACTRSEELAIMLSFMDSPTAATSSDLLSLMIFSMLVTCDRAALRVSFLIVSCTSVLVFRTVSSSVSESFSLFFLAVANSDFTSRSTRVTSLRRPSISLCIRACSCPRTPPRSPSSGESCRAISRASSTLLWWRCGGGVWKVSRRLHLCSFALIAAKSTVRKAPSSTYSLGTYSGP
mmetsp:Transcript_16410/g.49391  ORF Transcript_16410/g.49391 Transcript_16410/m.49391 type:complete len:286 (+) Transcript_16410:156-1013(+)